MNDPASLLLYVQNPAESAAFYGALLNKAPVEQSANFAMFVLDSGATLGLWARHDVQPAATPAGGIELLFRVDSREAVDEAHTLWARQGMPILQAPVAMDFGYTFVASDPDGHRLRVFMPAA
jgi:predicted enzyme related to lactoylglutathione lyase